MAEKKCRIIGGCKEGKIVLVIRCKEKKPIINPNFINDGEHFIILTKIELKELIQDLLPCLKHVPADIKRGSEPRIAGAAKKR